MSLNPKSYVALLALLGAATPLAAVGPNNMSDAPVAVVEPKKSRRVVRDMQSLLFLIAVDCFDGPV